MIDAADDLDRADRLRQEDAASTTAMAGTRNWSAVTRVGPSSLTPWKTTTLAMPRRQRARVQDREDDRQPIEAAADRSVVASWRDPERREDEPCRRRSPRSSSRAASGAAGRRAEDGVDRPAARRGQRQQVADERAAELEALAGSDDERRRRRTTRSAPSSLTALGVSAPIAMASSAVKTGVVAISSAESPAGMVCSATGHRIW